MKTYKSSFILLKIINWNKFIFAFFFLDSISYLFSVDSNSYWIKKDNIHHRTDTYKQDIVRMKFSDLKKKMDKDCRSNRSHSYYTCYNLGVYLINQKRYKEASAYLKIAYKQNNRFFYPVNIYRQIYPKSYHDIFAESKDKKYLYFYKAAQAAQKKSLTGTMEYLKKAKSYGLKNKELIENDSIFKPLLRNPNFNKFLSKEFSPVPEGEVNQLSYLFLKNSPLFGIIDEEYTWQVHKRKPDQSKVLFHYYWARVYAYRYQANKVIQELEKLFEKLEKKSISSSHKLSLQRYFLLFIMQSKPFIDIKKIDYKKYIEKKCDDYDISYMD